jgi:integral membrane sensor domain MASE1
MRIEYIVTILFCIAFISSLYILGSLGFEYIILPILVTAISMIYQQKYIDKIIPNN